MSSLQAERPANRLGKGTAFQRIPLVDIGPLFAGDGAAERATARAMASAASEVGFLYVTGHGLSPALIGNLEARAAEFFALPLAVKQTYYIGRSRAHRGYVPVGEERFFDRAESSKVDKKEAFDLSIELPEGDPDHVRGYRLLGPNQWPVEVAGFREDVYRYYEAATALGRALFGGFARALDLPDDFFAPRLTKPPSQLRLIHYAADPAAVARTETSERRSWGSGAHTDYECFTILHATTPGLEVLNAEGKWVDAPPVPGAFIINIGDMFETLSNGRFIATPHRVRDFAKERYSFPLFCALDYDTIVEPLPQFVDAGEMPRYPRFVAGDHLLFETMRTFTYLRRLQAEGQISLPASKAAGDMAFGRPQRV